MKIGFVVHFFDFRNDVRRVIEEVSRQHEVILFVRKDDLHLVEALVSDTVALRVVAEKVNSLKNRLWDQMFRFFGKLPRSVQNFYLMEYFKISLDARPNVRTKAYSLLALAMKLPKTITYDHYLKNISFSGKTRIDDIGQFICFTDISDSYLFARLLSGKKSVKVYVYSWDHPCKQVKFSRKATYLVWHQGIRQDMVELQNTPAVQVKVIGASQFGYIHDFLSKPTETWQNHYPFEYLYFGCAIGILSLAQQEVHLIKAVSQLMLQAGSRFRLVVRPYPGLKDWSVYDPLKQLPNVVLDDAFRTGNMSVSDTHIMEKYVKIHFAKAFIHLGTTMGLEACFTQTPSLILDFPEFKRGAGILTIANFVHQYQNDKYLMAHDFPNVVRSQQQFREILGLLDTSPDRLRIYNQEVVRNIPLKSFADFARDLIAA